MRALAVALSVAFAPTLALPAGPFTLDSAAIKPGATTDAEGRRAVAHRLRQARLRRTLSSAGRQAASLYLHRARAQSRQARRRREFFRGDGRLHDQLEPHRQGELHRDLWKKVTQRSES